MTKRIDAPAHDWTDGEAGPKHSDTCACQGAKNASAGKKDERSPIDAAHERADADAREEHRAGPPRGAMVRK